MFKRVFTAAIGAFLGFLISWGFDQLSPATSHAGTRTLFFIIATGSALVAFSEKLRIIPTIASINQPPSIR